VVIWRVGVAVSALAVVGLGACDGSQAMKRVNYYGISLAVPANWTVQGWPPCGGPNHQEAVYEMTPDRSGAGGVCAPSIGSKSGSHVWLSVECGTREGSGTTRVIRGVTVSGPLRSPGEYGVHYLLDPGNIVLAVSGSESQAILDSVARTNASPYPCGGIG
jgi:hypothetical protein